MDRRFRPMILIFCGCLTLIMSAIVEVGGGGASLIFVLSVPILIVLGVLFGISYWYLDKKSDKKLLKNIVFSIFLFILLGLTFLFYPYNI